MKGGLEVPLHADNAFESYARSYKMVNGFKIRFLDFSVIALLS